MPVVLAVLIPMILLLLVFIADIVRWQIVGHALQTGVDAAALAGAQEVWVRREVDASGQVWSQTFYLNDAEARKRAREVLDANLQRLQSAAGSITVVTEDVTTDQTTLSVRVRVVAKPGDYLATRFGLVPPQMERIAEAQPTVQ